ncbi:MAG TPA: adenylate/guanylate cyclase domain-containing protein [Candidatus Dormibacteraeota bacterium]|nr:adenylate/guanylate cyclase domain-containing protein [Candidatus Dormibacteraeota bacterium]
MIRAPVGRYLRYWYTYRTVVAVVIAVVLSGAIYWLYTQHIACDRRVGLCIANISVHPEDRFVPGTSPDPNIVIVGIDDQSLKTIGRYPVPRDVYAKVLQILEKDGASVAAFDIGFPDPRDPVTDTVFAKALATSKVPVVLGYAGDNVVPGDGKVIQCFGDRPSPCQGGVDEIPLRMFRCADPADPSDPSAPCLQPYPNVILASTDVKPDADGVVRRIPMFVQPACFGSGGCSTSIINSLGFAAYRAWVIQGLTGPELQLSNGDATFGSTWKQPLHVDSTGSALINYFGPPRNYQAGGRYVSIGDLINGTVSPDKIKGNIVLIGAYYLTSYNDSVLATTSAGAGAGTGAPMAGVEMHANVAQMFTPNLGSYPKFLAPEPPLAVFLVILVLGLVMALAVARLSVLWGLLATVVALVAFTFGMAILADNAGIVPDLFHPWLAIALSYSGVTAYRFLYEDREKRKVTRLFGTYLKPEIVDQLARTRGGVEDIMRGGERRDMTLLFVDIRGFTSMSESMEAHDVTAVVQMYLDHLSGIIFTWDGTVDKYVGDEIVAFWNHPRYQENHALLAVRCAYDMINRAPELQQHLLAKGLPPIRWGIGINTGPAVVGMMGSRSRLQYTALGDTVNTAARFCAHAPAFHVLIGHQTYEMCKDYIAVDMVPGVQLKGKSAETFRIYQLAAIRETPASPWVQFPTNMATQAHQAFTSQYTQQTVIAAGEAGSRDILVGEAAEQALAGQGPPPS